MSIFNLSVLPTIFPTTYAREWGQDKFGLFMMIEVQGIQQCFRWIKPGSFLMGPTVESDEQRADDEIQHQVTLSQGYWLADSTCTQALWMTVMRDNPSRFNEIAEHPVEGISWDDVQQFIGHLNKSQPGLLARLPSEAEWEYACRAGTSTAFSFGKNITPEQVNYGGNYSYPGAEIGEYRDTTVVVKSLPANPWGLYEMHGNVWEWCADWYGDYKDQAVTDPVGPSVGSSRVLRGGSGSGNARSARSAFREGFFPARRDGGIGFRLALGQVGVSPVGKRDGIEYPT